MRDEHMRPACWKGSTVLAQMSRSMRPADIVRCHRFGDGSKSIITIFGGNRHPLTSYYRVPMGTRVWPPFEHQLCCNLEGCPHVERDWRRDQYPGGRCGCLCCKVATIGGMACNHMQTVLVCVCMPVRAHAGFLMTGRLCWRTLSGFLSGKETSLFPAVSSHSVLNPASMCMLPQHLDPLAEIYWDTWSNKKIYIYNMQCFWGVLTDLGIPLESFHEGQGLAIHLHFFQPVLSKVPPFFASAVKRRCHFHQCSGVFYARGLLHRIRSCGAAWFNEDNEVQWMAMDLCWVFSTLLVIVRTHMSSTMCQKCFVTEINQQMKPSFPHWPLIEFLVYSNSESTHGVARNLKADVGFLLLLCHRLKAGSAHPQLSAHRVARLQGVYRHFCSLDDTSDDCVRVVSP